MIRLRKMRWAGYVAWVGRGGIHIGFWWESKKEKDHLENLDLGGKVILNGS
jgi:NADPH-dependent 7-cyano-7-deazaguanine reductase QueF